MLLKPYITEKALKSTDSGRYSFLVEDKATKGQIKDVLEKLYSVNVVSVRTLKKKPVSARSGRTGHRRTTSGYKKAIIQLKPKQTLPLFKTK